MPPIWAKPAGACRTSKFSTVEADPAGAEIDEHRQRLADRINTLPQEPPADLSDRGIVMAAGGRYIASAWVALTALLEWHGCRLPIEIWHLGDDDFPPNMRRLFRRFDVAFVDAGQVDQPGPVRRLDGWQLKPFAILHSRFAEVLFLDADNVPLRDPAPLLEDQRFRRTGAVFWPDIRTSNPFNPIWSICGLALPTGPEWESGQILVDKRRCWPALQLTLHFNRWSDFYYRYVLGDKETFHLAWAILGRSFEMPSRLPSPAYHEPIEVDDLSTSVIRGLWQHDFDGHRLFLHRTGAKWVAWDRNRRFPDFYLHDRCLAALEELRQSWDGWLPLPTDARIASQSIDAAWRARSFLYARRGFEARRLDLDPGGRVGRGAERAESRWRIEEDDGEPSLILSSRTEDTCRLRLESDGIWRGRWLGYEQTPVRLIPLDSADEEAGRSTSERPRTLLYISPVMPADSGNGLAMRAAAVLETLARTHRVSLLIVPLYSPGPARELPDWIPRVCAGIRWVPPPAPLDGPERDAPSDRLLYTAWIDAAGRAYPTETFDVIHIFRLATRPFAEPYLSRAASQASDWQIDLDDIESRTQQRLAGLYRRHGLSAEQAEAERRAAESVAVEQNLLADWDRIYVCSELDRDELENRLASRAAEIDVLPNVVRLPAVPAAVRQTDQPAILFIGTFSYFPNADAAVWLCREILPVIRELTAMPVRVLLIGAGAPPAVRDLDHIPGVELISDVPDVAPWYQQATIVVVPLRAGGGTRIKILEALAYGRPVVSTTIGAEGLDVRDGEHLLIADRAQPFARQCLRLLTNPALAARIATSGRRRVAERYARFPAAEPLTPHR